MSFAYTFDHTHDGAPRELRGLLGGKGANLAEMTTVLDLPVPPGFTISTDACRQYMQSGWPKGLTPEVESMVSWLEVERGQRLGDLDEPLLVSVRSGAKFSMPGMMDTVLNLGLNDDTVQALARVTHDERFAFDSYRRFIQMYANVVMGVPGHEFEKRFEGARRFAAVGSDAEVPADVLDMVIRHFKSLVEDHSGIPFPQDPEEQLRNSIEAVFRSWNAPRARAYRTRERIAHNLGTAVNVQAMVFGNRDDNSGTGVAFTRNPANGERVPYGDFLVNAQGEDVVAGISNTLPLDSMADLFPGIYRQLQGYFEVLELHYRDMLDIEFTIEQGKLWLLQTRVGKRSGAAAVRLAVAMTEDDRIRLSPAEAVVRITGDHVDQLLHPQFEKNESVELAHGLGASPGAAVGKVYFSADDCLDAVNEGEQVILVRQETSPEDIHGMEVAEGILTSRGGLVSHAAVVARGWGKPAVVGAEDVEIGESSFTAGGVKVSEGEVISLDGSTGAVVLGELLLTDAEQPPEFDRILEWADEIRAGKLQVRANADTGEDAAKAREFGAEGIGLCRTEHMFLGDRLPLVQRMILADTPEQEEATLAELLEVQRQDFEDILRAMDGLPVTVRLLDPPLHEFLPNVEEMLVPEATGRLDEDERALLEAARSWQEQNPMLGIRGVRLGILKDGLYRMQVRALMEAAERRLAVGGHPDVEIMIPLIVNRQELEYVRTWVEEEITAAEQRAGRTLHVSIGTMIETPRAAVTGADIAGVADFFSFGTNDLTQMTFGFSRDDVEGRMMQTYLDHGLLPRNPFETLDRDGVGELVSLAAAGGRMANPEIKLGVCGEHGGDPASIRIFHEIGMDYVSCSPYRVPVARIAAAQAVIGTDDE
ncbi:MAG: pyruvate, phosphate dikinase [Actinomycetia bacterium]|nr:pyruvate, phosphate dikinase [Actinomycetes bacterium]